MKTIQAIKLLLEEYKQHIERIVAQTKKEYDQDVKKAQAETMGKLKKLSMLFPDIMPVNDVGSMKANEVETMIANLKRRVETKYSARLLPSTQMLHDNIYGTDFYTPTFTEWQGATSKEANFIISYDKSMVNDAISAMNYLVGNMLLSLPIKRVHLNFVDLNFTGGAQLFTKNLDKSLFRDLIVDPQQLNDFCKELQQRMVTVLQDCGSLVEYNEQNQTYRYPYEVVVLLDYPNMYDYVAQQLAALFENGHKGGIYFVVLHNTDVKLSNQNNSLLDMKDHYSVLNLKRMKTAKHISLLESPGISKHLFRYINEEAKKEPEAKVMKADYEEMYQCPYEDTDSIINVPVGKKPDGEMVSFQMDTTQHVHSFIIGQTRSGKSVYLHGIIMGAMLRYKPEDLELYLLDFKTAGVEFARYQNSKHIKALLINNNDVQIVLEILNELKDSMTKRGKALVSAGVNNIKDYNKKNPSNHLPQILLVVDECHVMFNPGNSKNRKLFNEITSIITYIAREGGNQGVHLILATQTLANTDISSDILNNITDRCLLRCAPGDSERLVSDSSNKTSALAQGQVLYYHTLSSSENIFQSFYTPNFKDVIDLSIRKSQNSSGNGQFCYNGAQLFFIKEELINNLPAKRYNVAALGCSVDLQRAPVQISLKADDGENILFFGINDQEQVTRTVMNALVTIVYTARNNGRKLHTYVFDSLGMDDGKYLDVLDKLSDEGLIKIVKKRNWGTELHKMASGIIDGNTEPSLLVILGQERMRDLRLNNDIEIEETASVENDDSNFGKDLSSFDFGGNSVGKSKKIDISSYRKALTYILDNGPQIGMNTLLQVDQPSKILYEDYVNAKFVFGKFNHLVMLRSEEKAAVPLGLSDDIHLDQLPSEEERLRAIYYASDRDEYQTFTPYIIK